MRTLAGSNGMPDWSYSSFSQPAPMPSSRRPLERTSIESADMASTTGCRKSLSKRKPERRSLLGGDGRGRHRRDRLEPAHEVVRPADGVIAERFDPSHHLQPRLARTGAATLHPESERKCVSRVPHPLQSPASSRESPWRSDTIRPAAIRARTSRRIPGCRPLLTNPDPRSRARARAPAFPRRLRRPSQLARGEGRAAYLPRYWADYVVESQFKSLPNSPYPKGVGGGERVDARPGDGAPPARTSISSAASCSTSGASTSRSSPVSSTTWPFSPTPALPRRCRARSTTG